MSRLRAAIAFALLLASWAGAGCAGESAPELEVDAADWVDGVRRAHAAADAALSAGQVQVALERLSAALETPVPPQVQPEHRRVVHQDLCFRIAQAQLSQGRAGDARVAVERGLALGRAKDVFSANLLIARGAALEAEGRDTEAAASYYEALEINRALLDTALGQSDAGTP